EYVRSLPVDHHLVHPAPVEVGADPPLELVDEGVHLLIRRGPVEVAVLVRHVAVERRDRRVAQLGHGEPPSRTLIASRNQHKKHRYVPPIQPVVQRWARVEWWGTPVSSRRGESSSFRRGCRFRRSPFVS